MPNTTHRVKVFQIVVFFATAFLGSDLLTVVLAPDFLRLSKALSCFTK